MSLARLSTLAASVFVIVASALAQDPPAAASAVPDDSIKSIEAALKERKSADEDVRSKADEKAVAAVDQLLMNYKSFDEAGKKKALGAVTDLFSVRTTVDTENRLYGAAAAFCSDIGDEGVPPLEKALKLKHLEKRIDVQEILIQSLAKHKKEKHVDMFLDLLKGDQNRVIVSATRALGEYRDADGKLRKRIVEGLVKTYANVNALDVREKGKNPVWHERLQDIEVPMNETLGVLTLQSFQSAPEWEKWFNDNRAARW
ncbi:MAG: hypothetical protein IPH13_21510 [Planctomycetes bacterium]|nr:hypothetical protein [Planctomycetota bacterium]MCC7169431.1 hypothetical protein [Planctomycetota bacterium]